MDNHPKESFLSFVWQYQKFRNFSFKTTRGEKVIIRNPGYLNPNSGPDFSEASIMIGPYRWDGNIEIHVKSSEWYDHKHQNDKAYENVILHVVWENDMTVLRADHTEIPTLEINKNIEKGLFENYRSLVNGFSEIPCKSSLPKIDPLNKQIQLEKVGIERLKLKSEIVKSLLIEYTNNWEEITYILLAKNFGFKLNAAPFELLARSLPYNIIRQNRNSLKSIEALLFGQSNITVMMGNDNYSDNLNKDYIHLKKKYNLQPRLTGSEWKFMRTHPGNFPTIRIAQFSALLYKLENLFSAFIQPFSVKEYSELFKIEVSEYWKFHYMISKKKTVQNEKIGSKSIENIIINTITPLKTAFGIEIDDHSYIESAIGLLETLPAESNKYTRKMKKVGFPLDNGLHSQAAIHQFQHYCIKSKCLSCDIGYKILKN